MTWPTHSSGLLPVVRLSRPWLRSQSVSTIYQLVISKNVILECTSLYTHLWGQLVFPVTRIPLVECAGLGTWLVAGNSNIAFSSNRNSHDWWLDVNQCLGRRRVVQYAMISHRILWGMIRRNMSLETPTQGSEPTREHSVREV